MHACNTARYLVICYTGSTKTAKPQLTQQLPMPVAVQFSKDENIENAFIKLSAAVTDTIQHTNFDRFQRACIERARTPTMLHRSNEIIPFIKETNSFERLCSMLADTTYWNFLDIRMMETMATASMIPAAQETIENFKKTFFSMTLKEAAPYFPVIKVKPNHTELCEELDRDPSEMTIGELHRHRFYLETELLKTGPDTCTICRILIGSVTIIWQVHVEHAYQTYCRLKKQHFQPSLAIPFMSIPEMEKWEGLPFLWHGQDIGEIGPIETSTCVRHEPYHLLEGYEWSVLDSSNFNEIVQICKDNDYKYPISKRFLKWLTSSPLYKKGCLLGIRSLTGKMLVWVAISFPYKIRIGEKFLSVVHLQQVSSDAVTHQNHFDNVGIREIMRILGYEGIFQATLSTKQRVIPKSIIIEDMYTCDLCSHSLPYTTPRTVGLRRIKQSDVPKALALTNQYTSQFEIGQVFQSEEEFSYWFLSPLHDEIKTYVVEEPNSGNITDIFSFTTSVVDKYSEVAAVIALVITKSSPKQLITDLLVCMKQQNITFVTCQCGLKEHLFTDFFKLTTFQLHRLFYNYRYPEVGNGNYCLFA